MRFNWNKPKPASYWKHDVVGTLVFAVVTVLLWWLVGVPWWVPAWFVGSALLPLLKMVERPSSKTELAVADEVTVVQATAVTFKRFRG
ncbi:hypothetical protein ACWD7Y_04660 [Streptomyces drozdowiczii]